MSRSKKPTFLKRKHAPRRGQPSYEGDYVDGVKNDKGKKVIRKLTKEEKEWLNKFNREWVLNDHRVEDSLHRQLPNYLTEIKQELDNKTNARNREIHIEHNYELHDELVEDTSYTQTSYKQKLVTLNFHDVIDILIEDTLSSLDLASNKHQILFNFAKEFYKLTSEEIKEQRKAKKIKKGAIT